MPNETLSAELVNAIRATWFRERLMLGPIIKETGSANTYLRLPLRASDAFSRPDDPQPVSGPDIEILVYERKSMTIQGMRGFRVECRGVIVHGPRLE